MHLQSKTVSLSQFLPPPSSRSHFVAPRSCTFRKTSIRCSLSKPLPAEVSRTIMELSSVGTLSTITQDHWPLGVGVKFAVDLEGTPVLCLNQSSSVDSKSSLHVQFEQCGLRRTQCTILGDLGKPTDRMDLKRLHLAWKKRFGEDVDEDLIHFISVERVLQKEDIMEDGAWVLSSDYRIACPDPLRDFAEKIVNEINARKMEDVLRLSNIFVDMDFQVSEAKMIWVDRLGFDMRLCSAQKGVFEVRIPFPGEVTDEKGVKSTFNCMSQFAWEREKHYDVPDFEKIKQLKPIAHGVL